MTEKNIDHAINVIYFMALLVFVYRLMSSRNNSTSWQNEKSATPVQKSIWDKVSSVASIIGAIGSVFYAIVKLIEICK